jgi:hypothetical protein
MQIDINNDEISLKIIIEKIFRAIAFLKSKIKIIFITTIIGALLGYFYANSEPINYRATLTFAFEDGGSSGGGLSGALGIASSLGLDLGSSSGGAFAANNISALMTSRLLVEKTLLKSINIKNKNTCLANYYLQLNNQNSEFNQNITFSPNDARESFSRGKDSLLNLIYKSLIKQNSFKIEQKDKKITILTLEVLNKDELFAKLFCENIANEVSTYYILSKSKKAKLNVDILQRQTDSVKNELNQSINASALSMDNVYNLNPAFNIKGTPNRKSQINVQANIAILTQLVGQLELAKISLRKETPLIQIIDSPILPLQKIATNKLELMIYGSLSFFFFSSIFLIIKREYLKIMQN